MRGGGSTTAPPTLTTSTELAADAVKAFFAKQDASLATAIPTTGAAATALTDACSLNNGFSKALGIADYDADPLRVASRQFDIGSTRSNITVLADRPSTSADGTTRRELDVEYVINYTDGTKLEKATQTLISGSSSGSTMADKSVCAVAENKTEWRFFGNRKVVNTFVNATNERKERALLATGDAMVPPVVYSEYITLGVQDPANVATYATISGPGLVTNVGALPTAVKLVSARLLRDAPEFIGKNGHFVDWLNTDSFKICRTATGSFATAETAGCVLNGATTERWGPADTADPAALDAAFAVWPFVAGGDYTVKIYNDDGWKTVNGQAGKTPIATYTSKLEKLPFSAVALAGAAPATDLFAKILTSSMTTAAIATAVRGRGAFSVDVTYSQPAAMPDGRKLALGSLYTFKQGRQTVAQPIFNPASRSFDPTYPATSATSATVAVPAASANLGLPTYAELTFSHGNRNGNNVRSLNTFQ